MEQLTRRSKSKTKHETVETVTKEPKSPYVDLQKQIQKDRNFQKNEKSRKPQHSKVAPTPAKKSDSRRPKSVSKNTGKTSESIPPATVKSRSSSVPRSKQRGPEASPVAPPRRSRPSRSTIIDSSRRVIKTKTPALKEREELSQTVEENVYASADEPFYEVPISERKPLKGILKNWRESEQRRDWNPKEKLAAISGNEHTTGYSSYRTALSYRPTLRREFEEWKNKFAYLHPAHPRSRKDMHEQPGKENSTDVLSVKSKSDVFHDYSTTNRESLNETLSEEKLTIEENPMDFESPRLSDWENKTPFEAEPVMYRSFDAGSRDSKGSSELFGTWSSSAPSEVDRETSIGTVRDSFEFYPDPLSEKYEEDSYEDFQKRIEKQKDEIENSEFDSKKHICFMSQGRCPDCTLIDEFIRESSTPAYKDSYEFEKRISQENNNEETYAPFKSDSFDERRKYFEESKSFEI